MKIINSKKKTYVLFSIILLIFLLGCSRYDDGPAISFRTAKNRIIGTWQVEKRLINDLDSTDKYRQQIGCEWEFTEELFTEDGERYVIYYKDCIDDTIRKGVWYFYNNLNNELMVGFSSDIYSNPIGPIGRWGSWDILRLTNDEMHLWIKPSKDYWGHPKETTYYLELNKLQYETLFNNNHVNNCNSFSFYI